VMARQVLHTMGFAQGMVHMLGLVVVAVHMLGYLQAVMHMMVIALEVHMTQIVWEEPGSGTLTKML
jgi:hypothetical protein